MNTDNISLSSNLQQPETARASYDLISRWYDLFTGSSERKLAAKGIAMLDIKPGDEVLEIGFGTGHALIPLARAVGEVGKVHGIDISPGMLAVAARRITKAGLADRVELATGDATSLPYPDASQSAVFMSFVLELFPTPLIPQVLAECRRVLRANGHLCVVAMSTTRNTNLITQLYLLSHKLAPRFVDCRPISVDKVIAKAGFSIAETEDYGLFGLAVKIVLANKPL
jgi:ubiquinone/menaquinone biosynthesis C-methylase UbiE